MKLSVDIPNPLNDRVIIKLDGVVQEKVVEVDDEEGYVVKYKLNELGQMYLDGDEVPTETLYGEVEIIDPEVQNDQRK